MLGFRATLNCTVWYRVKLSGRLNVIKPSRVSIRVSWLNSEYGNISRNVFHCIGDSVTTIVARCKKTKNIRLDKPEKLSVAEHSIETGHSIDFSRTPQLDTKWRQTDRFVKQAIPMLLYTNNFYRDSGLLASFPCKVNTFRERVKNVVTSKGIRVGIECK